MSHYMRQAITTKYLPPSNVRGARVKATCEARSIILPWDHALNVEDNHTAAARKLADLLEWHGTWYGGAPAGKGYCFVLADEAAFTISKPVLVEPLEKAKCGHCGRVKHDRTFQRDCCQGCGGSNLWTAT